ncbi:MAG: GGDEF domain-containing protein [Alphaproteobacteria bacterium]
MAAPIPHDEADRQAALDRYAVLDTPPEASFDRITRLASMAFGAPIALVSLIDRDRQWFKSRQGLAAEETPREHAFCAHAILDSEPLVVEDATEDVRFADNPLVTGAPDIRFYAGAPLTAPDGHNLGTLCVIDRQPRRFDDGQRRMLADLAAMVVDELELRRLASVDALTGTILRGHFMHLGTAEVRRAHRYGRPLSVLVFDVDHFKRVNDNHGHAAGDAVLRAISSSARDILREQDVLGRTGGEEFAVLLPDTDKDAARQAAERLRRAIAAAPVDVVAARIAVTVSVGVTSLSGAEDALDAMLARADAALYRAKASGRDRVELDG